MIRRFTRALASFDFGRVVSMRLVVMGVGMLTTLISAGVIVDRDGIAEYAQFALIVGLLAAIPFADLGLGAGLVNAMGDRLAGKLSQDALTRQVSATLVVLSVVGLAVMAVGLALSVAGIWELILGSAFSEGGAVIALVVTTLLGASIPAGVGLRLLQGAGRTYQAVALSLVGSGLQISTLVLYLWADFEGTWLAVGAAVGLWTTNALCTVFALRMAQITVRNLIEHAFPVRFSRGYRPTVTALPYLISIVGAAAVLQWPRFVLAQVGTNTEVAIFAFVAQFSTAITSVVTLSSINLWPMYRTALHDSSMLPRRLARDIIIYGVIGFVAGSTTVVGVLFTGPLVVAMAPAVLLPTTVASALFVISWALSRPSTMFLNGPVGLWIQAACAVPLVAVSLVLAMMWGESAGAAGVMLATTVATASVLVPCQTAASLLIIRLRRRDAGGEQ